MLDREAIKQLLPHREPFLWVDRVMEREVGVRTVAELDIDPEWPHFQGHFPGHPVMPGVLLLEAMAQTAGLALAGNPANEGKLGFLVKVDNAKFRRQVLPGETLRMEAGILKANHRSARAHIEAFVGDELCAECDQMYVFS